MLCNEKVTAYWQNILTVVCPYCGDTTDLLIHPNFWDDRDITMGETGTQASENQEANCPECNQKIKFRCEKPT